MFTVRYLPLTNMVIAELAGFLSLPEVHKFAAEAEVGIRRAAAKEGGYMILLDVSACAIQSRDVVEAFQQHVVQLPKARRCAVVTGSSLIRMQIRRIINNPSIQMFDNDLSAKAWLLVRDAPLPDRSPTALSN